MDANKTRRNAAITDSTRPPDEVTVLRMYETLEVLAGDLASVSGEAALAELLDHVKRSILNPGSPRGRGLMRAIARYEVVNRPVPDDPELRK